MTPGIYPDIEFGRYQAGLTKEPALSSGTIHTLLTASPLHAWTRHPQLNPNYQREEKEDFDMGTAAHAMLLEGSDAKLAWIEHDDFRTKAAKEARDEARSKRLTPVKVRHRPALEKMVETARWFLRDCEFGDLLAFGKPEQTLIWMEGPTHCRGRADWITHSGQDTILDYKSTGGSASPEAWIRNQLTPSGYDLQAMWYARGFQKITGRRPRFVFLVQENEPPYACSLVGLSPSAEAFANERIDIALDLWRRCLESNDWAGYQSRVCYAEPNQWDIIRWQEKLSMEAMGAER